ncbi:MAG: hypothetical protein PVG39_31520 [Desulfobacteraceae bacterium]
MDKIIEYLEEYSDEPIEEQVRLRNIEFLERLKAGKVNYEWTVGNELHEKQKAIVEQLSSERRTVEIEVKRLKDMDKATFEEVMGEALR